MLDQKKFGEKLRGHRKNLGMTQEEAAERIGVSAQAISKWEAGDCLPDCFNLKAISDVYRLSVDVLLDTESDGDIDAAARRIEQIGTEFIWANAGEGRYEKNLRCELGDDLWKMWKGLYFAEVGNRRLQQESKQQGNLRIVGSFGMKIWDDDGVACVVKSSLIPLIGDASPEETEVLHMLCSPDGQKLISALSCSHPVPKREILEKTAMDTTRLNELLLLFTENKIIEFVPDYECPQTGYLLSGHCGIAAYMILAARYVLQKKRYSVSQFVAAE